MAAGLGEQGGVGVEANVGDGVQPQVHGGGEHGLGLELSAVQEALLHVADRVLDAALGLRMRRGAGLDLEAVMAGEGEVPALKTNAVRGLCASTADVQLSTSTSRGTQPRVAKAHR